MEFSIKGSLKNALKEVDGLKDQIPFIKSRATDNLAYKVREELYKEMREVYDRPTPYVVPKNIERPGRRGSLFVKRTNRKKNDFTAIVNVKDISLGNQRAAIKFLRPTIYGTTREAKGFERALQRQGILPKGMITVPGKDAPLDKYGNVRAGQIVQMLSYLKANPDAYQNTTTRSEKRKSKVQKYLILRRGRTPIGIFRRSTSTSRKTGAVRRGGLESFLLFVRQPAVNYRVLFDFDRVAGKAASEHGRKITEEAVRFALANPKRKR